MDRPDIKRRAISGIIWQTAQKFSNKFVSLAVSILLARLLDPDDFGLVALTSIFLTLATVFSDSGLGVSLVQKKDVDHLDNNTVFFFGLFVSAIIYVILFFCAPLIAGLYNKQQLVPIVRILGINLLFSSISSVQCSLVSRKLEFKKFFYVSLIATILSGAIGVFMAFSGYGVWALIGQSLTSSVVNVVVLNRMVKWLPKFEFSFDRLKQLYKFGLNYMGASLIGTLFGELKGFLVGLKYSPADLAYYNRGSSIPSFVNGTVSGTISGVLFPTISRVQDDKSAVKTSIRRSMMSTTFLMAPLMFLMIGAAESIILLLYSFKWAAAIPFMQVIAVEYLLTIMGSANLQALNAIGRSDLVFRLEFVKKPVYLAILLYTMTISPLAIAIGNTLYCLYGASINALPNKKLIGYSYREQLSDILPSMGLGLISGVIVFLIGKIHLPVIALLVVQVSVGMAVYLSIAALLKMESYIYLRNTLLDYFKK